MQNFSSNPFFEDKKLSKTYSFSDEGTTTITGTTITWKEGMVTDQSHFFLLLWSNLFRTTWEAFVSFLLKLLGCDKW